MSDVTQIVLGESGGRRSNVTEIVLGESGQGLMSHRLCSVRVDKV